MLTNPETEDVIQQGRNLSREAQAVAEQASLVMKQWIDQQIAAISQQARTDLTTAKESIDTTFAGVDEAFGSSKRSLDAILEKLGSLRRSADGDAALHKALAELETATKAASDELERRKETFRAGGAAVATTLGKAVKALV